MDEENRETWQARLWIANDEGLYYGVKDIIGEGTKVQDVPYSDVREYIEDYLTALAPQWEMSNLLGDIVSLWLDRVDWRAVAEASVDE